jgi:hypothetical protein
MEWIDGLAAALGVDNLTAEEISRLLAASRRVAHEVERMITPLAADLVGVAAGFRMSEGADQATALSEMLATLEERLPGE